MNAYPAGNERMMKRLFGSLKESDRRRYAAIAAAKLGYGGLEYVARVLECDPKTIRQGQAEREGGGDLDMGRVRKKREKKPRQRGPAGEDMIGRVEFSNYLLCQLF